MSYPATEPQTEIEAATDPAADGVIFPTPEEGRRMFDEAARKIMGMSGEEFIRRWEAGEFDATFDQEGSRYIDDLASLIPFARIEP